MSIVMLVGMRHMQKINFMNRCRGVIGTLLIKLKTVRIRN